MVHHLSKIYKFFLFLAVLFVITSVVSIIIIRKAGETIALPSYLIDDINISENYHLTAKEGNVSYLDIFSGLNIELIDVEIYEKDINVPSVILPKINFKLDIISSLINSRLVIGKFYIENLQWNIEPTNQDDQLSALNYDNLLQTINTDNKQLISLFLGIKDGFLILNSSINIKLVETPNLTFDIEFIEVKNIDDHIKLSGRAKVEINNKVHILNLSQIDLPAKSSEDFTLNIVLEKFIPSDLAMFYDKLEFIDHPYKLEILVNFKFGLINSTILNLDSLKLERYRDSVVFKIDHMGSNKNKISVLGRNIEFSVVRNLLPKKYNYLQGEGNISINSEIAVSDILDFDYVNLSVEMLGSFTLDHEEYQLTIDAEETLDNIHTNSVFDRISASLNWQSSSNYLSVRSLEVDINQAKIKGSAGYGIADESIKVDVSYDDLLLTEIVNFIPRKTFPNVYIWMKENMVAGVAKGSYHFRKNGSREESYGDFVAKDSIVHYLRPMAPISDLQARGVISQDKLELTVISGKITDLEVERNSKVDIIFGAPFGFVEVDGNLNGHVTSMIKLANSDPINFLADRGINFENEKGQGHYGIKLRTPTKDDPAYEEIQVNLDIDLFNLSYTDGPYSIPVSSGYIKLLLDKQLDYFKIVGKARLGESQSDINWHQTGLNSLKQTRKILLKSFVEPSKGILINFDTSNRLEGMVDLSIDWQTSEKGDEIVNVSYDITKALLVFPSFNFVKVIGTLGKGNMKIESDSKSPSLLRIYDSNITFGDEILDISGLFNTELNELQSFNLSGSKYGQINNFVIYFNSENDKAFSFKADDVSSNILLGMIKTGSSSLGSDRNNNQAQTSMAKDIDIALEVKKIIFNNAEDITNFKFNFKTVNQKINNISLQAQDSEGKDLLKLEPVKDNNYLLEVFDLGKFFSRLNIGDVVTGGVMKSNLKIDVVKKIISGEYNLKEARLLNAPAIVKVFEAFSVAGIPQTFSDEGTAISEGAGEFIFDGTKVNLQNGSVKTATTDLTYAGDIDFARKQMKIEGTFTPLYQINQLIGNIPIIKELLTDPKSSGSIFSIRYKLEGGFDDVEISSNPLYAIIPGILKQLENFEVKPEDKLPIEEKLKQVIEKLSKENEINKTPPDK